jgi:hypothetical protein
MDSMSTSKRRGATERVYHVRPGWIVEAEGRIVRASRLRSDALAHARFLRARQPPAHLVEHRRPHRRAPR